MSKKFWSWIRNDAGIDELRIDGYIGEESWFYDTCTPEEFKSELSSRKGDITVWINSGGGEVFAGAQIYNMLKEYSLKNGKITIKIDALAASAASVIAMAGNTVLMSPVAQMMIHNPATIIMGDVSEMEKGIEMLNEVKESLVNAYQEKTGLSRAKISKLMDSETWFNAKAAVREGFADGVLYGNIDDLEEQTFNKNTQAAIVASAFSKKLQKIGAVIPEPAEKTPLNTDNINKQYERLYSLKTW